MPLGPGEGDLEDLGVVGDKVHLQALGDEGRQVVKVLPVLLGEDDARDAGALGLRARDAGSAQAAVTATVGERQAALHHTPSLPLGPTENTGPWHHARAAPRSCAWTLHKDSGQAEAVRHPEGLQGRGQEPGDSPVPSVTAVPWWHW